MAPYTGSSISYALQGQHQQVAEPAAGLPGGHAEQDLLLLHGAHSKQHQHKQHCCNSCILCLPRTKSGSLSSVSSCVWALLLFGLMVDKPKDACISCEQRHTCITFALVLYIVCTPVSHIAYTLVSYIFYRVVSMYACLLCFFMLRTLEYQNCQH